MIIATGVIIVSFLLQISYYEWLITLLALREIFIQEIANSIREDTLNIVCLEINKEIGLAKDKSAGEVLIAGIFLLAIEIIILGPKIIALFH